MQEIRSVLKQRDIVRRLDGENEWLGRFVWPGDEVGVECGQRAEQRLGFRLFVSKWVDATTYSSK
jgi:hypothetical protein